jgi:hypothetical protein
MDLIFKCKKDLQQIRKCKTIRERRKFIRNSKKCFIDAISEISKNCLIGNLPLNKCQFKYLKNYRTVLRKLSKKSPTKKRRNIIIQKGGFLNILIPTALYLLKKTFEE